MTNIFKTSKATMSLLVLVLVLAMISSVASMTLLASDAEVSGLVQDTSSNNLPGVSVKISNSELNTLTDANGRYVLNVNGNAAKRNTSFNLYFSCQGYYSLSKAGVKPGENVSVKLRPISNDDGFVKFVESISMSHAATWLRSKDRKMSEGEINEKTFDDAVKKFGLADEEQVVFRVRLPEKTTLIKGIFLISEHGMGQKLLESKKSWKYADKNGLALIGVIGNPIQRGIYPASTLDRIIAKIGEKLQHPELATAPVLTFGHSNGTGFSALYAALRPDRTLGWVSYHSGECWHLEFPGVEKSPGLVMHGTKDIFFKGQDKTIERLRAERNAPIAMMVEGNIEHWPSDMDSTIDFIHDFGDACLRTRMGKESLKPIDIKLGWLGDQYDPAKGVNQKLQVSPYLNFSGNKDKANWFPDERFAGIWQKYGAGKNITDHNIK